MAKGIAFVDAVMPTAFPTTEAEIVALYPEQSTAWARAPRRPMPGPGPRPRTPTSTSAARKHRRIAVWGEEVCKSVWERLEIGEGVGEVGVGEQKCAARNWEGRYEK